MIRSSRAWVLGLTCLASAAAAAPRLHPPGKLASEEHVISGEHTLGVIRLLHAGCASRNALLFGDGSKTEFDGLLQAHQFIDELQN